MGFASCGLDFRKRELASKIRDHRQQGNALLDAGERQQADEEFSLANAAQVELMRICRMGIKSGHTQRNS